MHGQRLRIPFYDASFPSGHMIRGTVVAAILILSWPRARRWILLWVAFVAPALVVSAAHTPSDVLGGLIVGVALLQASRALTAAAEAGAGPRVLRLAAAARLRRPAGA